MMHTEETRKVIRRLQIAEGHVRAIQRMVENGDYCIDILKQISAVQSALSKVSQIILENHLNTCVTSAVRGDDPAERERVLREIAEVFRNANRG
ncbi:MAG: metal-sensitive transcriptional regulator [Candidatus Roseilinea sp.]|uniref:metal-sensitive transcriptional regulator n=1 Tax=Candidatus Roseilinea sp. TaxID=2838777 RepID=UPI00404A9292